MMGHSGFGRASDNAALKRIQTDLEHSLFVEANAGSGKTTALVQRITSLLISGTATIDQIAAITFTRSAASELRSRVREELELVPDMQTLSDVETDRVARALDGLDSASIQTIDGFAVSLLRERPLEAGLPPLIKVKDEIETEITLEERWRKWLESALNDPEFISSLRKVGQLGLTDPIPKLREVTKQFASNYDLIDERTFELKVSEPLKVSCKLIKERADLVSYLEFCKDPQDTLYQHVIHEVLPLIDKLDQNSDEDSLVSTLAEAPRLSRPNRGAKTKWGLTSTGYLARDHVRELLAVWQENIDAELSLRRRIEISKLLLAVAQMILEYSVDRKFQGTVEFHDTLIWVRDTLLHNPEVSRHFRQRFPFLLIDEFQDTDPVQIEIAKLLAGGYESDGSLFLVGDPKQSIYRFRRADLRTLVPIRDSMKNGLVKLTTTHRMHERLAEWINHVFIQEMVAGKDQPPYEPLVAASSWPVETVDSCRMPRPGVHLLGRQLEATRIETVRNEEAAAIAKVALAIGAGGWQIRESDSTRPSHFGDLCIVMPRRTGLAVLERALRIRRVPYSLEGQTTSYSTQEVTDIVNAMTAINDPTDQIAIVATLRSVSFGCSDTDLWDWYRTTGTFDYSEGDCGADGSVGRALTVLSYFNQLSGSVSVPVLIERFIRARCLRELAAFKTDGRERIRRMDLMTELARRLIDSGRHSLREFIEWSTAVERGRQPKEEPLNPLGQQVVRLMTVHAAKGLEFPIVLLTGINDERRTDRSERVIFDLADDKATRQVEVRLGPRDVGFETQGYEAAAQRDQSAAQAENIRLLYVACSRAKDHLIVSLYRKIKDDGSQAARLAALAAQRPELADQLEPSTEFERLPAKPLGEVWGNLVERANLSDTRRQALEAAAEPAWVSATSLKVDGDLTAGGAVVGKSSLQSDDKAQPAFPIGAAVGLAVHAVLQEVGPGGRARVQKVATQYAMCNDLSEKVDEIVYLVRAVLRAPVVRRASKAGWWDVEVPVSAAIESDEEGQSIVIDGIIDLIYETPNGLGIVDYKTDSLWGKDIEAASVPYLLQLGAYAWAAERTTGLSVTEAVIVFARLAGGRLQSEYRVPDLAGAMSLAVERALVANKQALLA